MTRAETATLIFTQTQYNFDIHTETETISVRATTEQMSKLAVHIENLPWCLEISTGHPEFLGWTTEEIANNLTESDALSYTLSAIIFHLELIGWKGGLIDRLQEIVIEIDGGQR